MKRFGIMLDMSRNAVMKPDALKNYISILKDFGYNMVQLYTEDTYEVEGEPYFGYLRGRYSKEELSDIVAFCDSIGMEIIPCIQTLAHLGGIFKWDEYKAINDVNDILLVGEERTYTLIDNMFKTLRSTFKSEYIHIGMDEAHMLGLGKYLDKHGFGNRFDILYAHLKKVIEIAKKYSFKPIMWSDMFFRLANHGRYFATPDMVTPEVVSACPEGVELVYWDYYNTSDAHYRNMITSHKKFRGETWFAGGAWTWKGFAPGNEWSIESMTPAMKVCAEENIENIFMTLWGDNGKECSFYAVLPALYAIRRIYDGVCDMDVIKAEFLEKTGESFDAMMLLDKPDYVGVRNHNAYNPSKHMLYSDPFLGFFDYTVSEGGGAQYAKLSKELHTLKTSSKYGYIFNSMASLCDVMELKYELGVRTRNAYARGDLEGLSAVERDCRELVSRIDIFYDAFRELWFRENKPHGFDVQDQRIGGLRMRIISCANRLKSYIAGDIESIPELEEKIIGRTDGNHKSVTLNRWESNISPNVTVGM